MENKVEPDLYSVRCIFRHRDLNSDKFVYEERITLWQASSFQEATEMAQQEARQYAKEIDCIYTGLSQTFHLIKNEFLNGLEVFSLMRQSDKNTKEYLDSYFDTGKEKQRTIPSLKSKQDL
jgi:hypothetical protein